MKNSHKKEKKRVKAHGKETMVNDHRLSLAGFSTPGAPDVSCIKFVYSDYRALTSSVSEGEYVFRLNSCFDPDFTGVGGQPDYFDQWKLLYTKYRVVACEVEIMACGFSGIGFISMAPTVASTSLTNAIEAAGLRHAVSRVFTLGQGSTANLKKMYRMSELEGCSDETVLADNEFSALVGANPTKTYYLHVNTRTNGASDVTDFAIKLTMYTRMEAADYKLDSFARHKRRAFFGTGASDVQKSPPVETNHGGTPLQGLACQELDTKKTGIGSPSPRPELDTSALSPTTLALAQPPIFGVVTRTSGEEPTACQCWRK